MRVIVKGGVWKNTEDEVLKAAVSKYGKNQWARISSLLVRKTPKQCKARWFEWLDPSIKKTEWSKEEDEKLLHLAKLMPTQWRTIAPIVGRTPTQCLERYQRLLDEAEAKDSGELGLTGSVGPESGPSADDVRRLRPGEIDPDPEAKPARPDPVDMDEDEKEMLSEARARLANTQGKKAKRKARERQLEEARRLTTLQKRRELKAAGIELKPKKKKKNQMDYNADIPFEKRPALGFYDTTEEHNRPVDHTKLTNTHLSKLNQRKADREEEKERDKKRKAKDKQSTGGSEEGNKGNFVLASNMKKIQEAEQVAKRRKLVLPSPQVGESELEQIVKVGFAGQNAASLDEDGNAATAGLVGDYSITPSGNMPARTPRTTAAKDNIMNEARNLRALSAAQTPLLGEDNTPLAESQGTGFVGATPVRSEAQTPNPMMTPLRGKAGAATSELEQTPLRTPMRDSLKINEENGMVGQTPREEKMRMKQMRNSLKSSLAGLPRPKNEYEIRLPEMDEDDKQITNKPEITPDMAEVDKQEIELQEQQEQDRLRRRSQAIQKSLPRPVTIKIADLPKNATIPQQLIHEELVRLLEHDSVAYPVPGGKIAPGVQKAQNGLANIEDEFDNESLDQARQLLDEEVAQFLGVPAEEDVKKAIWDRIRADSDKFEDVWSKEHKDVLFSAEKMSFLTLDEFTDDKSKIAGLQKMLEANRQSMTQDATRAAKIEKKLNIVLGGYQARSQTLQKQILETFEQLESAESEHQSFINLQISEAAAIPRRIEALQKEVHFLTSKERTLQDKYKALATQKNEIVESILQKEQQQNAQAAA
ncbi:hypothetical protein INT43_007827 [Umbelopsis isabellina]|uniref:Uncharacterized protein n=1 Tax=Mortierella isabellina TaxID=91625 RepID=A0A8H7UBU3_MORIS|nr:hypothetical protein INT43_007827 [Umbelopsis isabellina]